MKNRIFAVLAICTVAIAAAQVRQATNDPLPVPGANDLPLLGKILPGYNNVDGTVGKVVDWDYIDGIPASLLTSQAETKTYWSNPTTYDPAGQRLTFTFDVQPSVFDPGDRIFFLSPDNLDDSEDVFVVDDGLRSDRELIDADRFLLSPLDIKANRYTEVFFGYHANGQTAWVLNQSILVASGRYTRYIVAKIGDDNVDFPTAADFLNTAIAASSVTRELMLPAITTTETTRIWIATPFDDVNYIANTPGGTNFRSTWGTPGTAPDMADINPFTEEPYALMINGVQHYAYGSRGALRNTALPRTYDVRRD